MTNEEYLIFKAGIDKEMKDMYEHTLDLFAKTDKKFAKTDKKFAETDKRFVETEAQIKRTEAQIAKSEAKLAKMGIQFGGMSNNSGSVTEEYFYNSMLDNPVLGGVTYDFVDRNIKGNIPKVRDEFDIVMFNGNSIALIECKYKAHENDLRKIIDKKANNFRALFPDFKAYKIYLGLASFSFYDELKDMAKQNGIAILTHSGDLPEIIADNLKAY